MKILSRFSVKFQNNFKESSKIIKEIIEKIWTKNFKEFEKIFRKLVENFEEILDKKCGNYKKTFLANFG